MAGRVRPKSARSGILKKICIQLLVVFARPGLVIRYSPAAKDGCINPPNIEEPVQFLRRIAENQQLLVVFLPDLPHVSAA
jgi:hypothetical protein